MSYLARPALLSDLEVGQEILYFAGGEYVPGIVNHGVIERLFEFQSQGGSTVQFLPVKLDSGRLPIRLFSSRPLYIIGP